MEEQNTNAVFDDVARDAAVDLLEQFWILREREPEKYLRSETGSRPSDPGFGIRPAFA